MSILNHLIASPPNSKSAYFYVKPGKEMQHKWTTRVDGTQRRGNSLPFSFSCGLILKLKITLNYKHCASGSRSLLRNRPISSLMAVWEITGLEEMHFERPPHVYIHPHFDISNLHTDPFQKLHKEQPQVLPEKHRSFREHEWRMNVQHVSEQVLRDPAGAQSELLLIYIFNHSDWIWNN